jgi:hypothetical protein
MSNDMTLSDAALARTLGTDDPDQIADLRSILQDPEARLSLTYEFGRDGEAVPVISEIDELVEQIAARNTEVLRGRTRTSGHQAALYVNVDPDADGDDIKNPRRMVSLSGLPQTGVAVSDGHSSMLVLSEDDQQIQRIVSKYMPRKGRL